MAELSDEQPLLRQELYQPLSSTEYRIVHLFPGDFADDIQCALEIRDSSIRIKYEAISYEWGDETDAKPIHVARLDAPPRRVSNPRGPRLVERVCSVYRLAMQLESSHPVLFCIFLAFPFACLLWRIMPFVEPAWVPFFIPTSISRAATCLVPAVNSAWICQTSFRLIQEILETKIWNLRTIGWRTRKENVSLSKFEALYVTRNLENALRHLRRSKGVRILWIDALCIDQKNEAEKLVQVQKMDWIYANAYMVLIWLGGYHHYQNGQSCGDKGVICAHQEQIELAFTCIRGSLWGISRCFRAIGYTKPYEKGWWQRLWVVQEVALATGNVRIQCGHSTCSYDDFDAWFSDMPAIYPGGLSFEKDSIHVVYFLDLIRRFRYDFKADKALHGFYTMVLEVEDFARDLCNILLRTSGSFKCRDNEDRLYAVLGIVAGVQPRKHVKLVNISSFVGSISMLGMLGISNFYDALLKEIWLSILATVIGFGMLFFETRARY
ncbi:unnamed protein product [Clonostachys solani]|uniref:Heterokaryon incompatibility domain-containing protein n=1 Tax=Clonostachys solani TaxID=160281 RepID=A0A9P0EL14_9HYPO|nr:unnamed protein product [Clonostachys solani]